MTAPNEMRSVLAQDDRRFAALKRLEASRVRLQGVLIAQRRPQSASDGHGGSNSGWSETARTLWSFLRSRNVADMLHVAGSFVGRWWKGHPWQPTASLLGKAVESEVSPWVRKNPVAAIAIGVIAGAAIARIRPWRWHALHVPARSLQRSAGHWMLSELASPAMQMFIATTIAAWIGQRNGKPSAAPDSPGKPAEWA